MGVFDRLVNLGKGLASTWADDDAPRSDALRDLERDLEAARHAPRTAEAAPARPPARDDADVVDASPPYVPPSPRQAAQTYALAAAPAREPRSEVRVGPAPRCFYTERAVYKNPEGR